MLLRFNFQLIAIKFMNGRVGSTATTYLLPHILIQSMLLLTEASAETKDGNGGQASRISSEIYEFKFWPRLFG